MGYNLKNYQAHKINLEKIKRIRQKRREREEARKKKELEK